MRADEEDLGGANNDLGRRRVAGMSVALDELDRALRVVQAELADRPARSSHMPISAEQVRAIIEARRRRALLFSPSRLSDPGWEVLLELYAALLEQRSQNISELTQAVGLPGTTVLSWLQKFHHQGLLTRREDPHDIRKVRVGLSVYGKSQMDRCFAGGAQLMGA